MNIGYNVIGIRTAHKMSDREVVVNILNDANSSAHVLVTSSRLMATGYNLQHDCCDMIFVDCP